MVTGANLNTRAAHLLDRSTLRETLVLGGKERLCSYDSEGDFSKYSNGSPEVKRATRRRYLQSLGERSELSVSIGASRRLLIR
eukprot:6050372-Amphidinium_carterae.1